jgi:hypothetical protein
MKKFWIMLILLTMVFGFNTNSFAQTANATVSGVQSNVTYAPVTNNTSDPNLGNAALQAADNPNAYRGFAMGTPVTYGTLISHFGPRSNSGGFQSVQDLLLYVSIFTEGALENMAAGKADFSVVNDYKNFPKAGSIRDARWIMIVIQERKVVKDANGKDVVQLVKYPAAAFKGFSSAWATKEKQKMQHIMANAALAALKNNCNVLEVTMEGASIDTVSSGWGVGFNANGAYMAPGANQPTSFGSTVGAGYSESQAGMRDLPWVNANGLVIPNDVFAKILESSIPLNTWDPPAKAKVEAPAPAKADAPQTGNHKPKS